MLFDTRELQANLKILIGKLTTGIPLAGERMLDTLMLESQREVPLDTGWLENSAEVLPGVQPQLVYRGPYAAYQHEGVREDGSHVVHNWQHGRKKKYISDPLVQKSPELLNTVVIALRAGVME